MGDEHLDGAHDALNRMKRAHERGTGCHLTADMIHTLSVTMLGEMWASPDPRTAPKEERPPCFRIASPTPENQS